MRPGYREKRISSFPLIDKTLGEEKRPSLLFRSIKLPRKLASSCSSRRRAAFRRGGREAARREEGVWAGLLGVQRGVERQDRRAG